MQHASPFRSQYAYSDGNKGSGTLYLNVGIIAVLLFAAFVWAAFYSPQSEIPNAAGDAAITSPAQPSVPSRMR